MHPAAIVLIILLVAIAFIVIKIIISRSGPVLDSSKNLCIAQNETLNSEFFVSNYLDRLEANSYSCDAQIITGNVTNRVHSVLIAAYSVYFEKEFHENGLKAVLPASARDATRDFIDFVYDDGKLPDDVERQKNLLRFAATYKVSLMKCGIEKLLHKAINDENALQLMKLSNETESQFLLTAVSHYVVDHFQELKNQKKGNTDLGDCLVLALDIDKRRGNEDKAICEINCPNIGLNSPEIVDRLKRSFIIGQFTNAQLEMTNHSFHINKNIFVDQSEIWKNALKGHNVAELPYNADFYTMKQFLIYMYSGWVPEIKINTEKLLTIANEYGMHPLKSACEDIFLSKLNIENAADKLLLSSRVESSRLKEESLNFFLAHRNEITKTKGWTELKKNNLDAFAKIIGGL